MVWWGWGWDTLADSNAGRWDRLRGRAGSIRASELVGLGARIAGRGREVRLLVGRWGKDVGSRRPVGAVWTTGTKEETESFVEVELGLWGSLSLMMIGLLWGGSAGVWGGGGRGGSVGNLWVECKSGFRVGVEFALFSRLRGEVLRAAKAGFLHSDRIGISTLRNLLDDGAWVEAVAPPLLS